MVLSVLFIQSHLFKRQAAVVSKEILASIRIILFFNANGFPSLLHMHIVNPKARHFVLVNRLCDWRPIVSSFLSILEANKTSEDILYLHSCTGGFSHISPFWCGSRPWSLDPRSCKTLALLLTASQESAHPSPVLASPWGLLSGNHARLSCSHWISAQPLGPPNSFPPLKLSWGLAVWGPGVKDPPCFVFRAHFPEWEADTQHKTVLDGCSSLLLRHLHFSFFCIYLQYPFLSWTAFFGWKFLCDFSKFWGKICLFLFKRQIYSKREIQRKRSWGRERIFY